MKYGFAVALLFAFLLTAAVDVSHAYQTGTSVLVKSSGSHYVIEGAKIVEHRGPQTARPVPVITQMKNVIRTELQKEFNSRLGMKTTATWEYENHSGSHLRTKRQRQRQRR